MFEATCTAANSLLAAVRGARVHRDGQTELLGGGCQGFHFVVEPCHAGGIVARAEIAAGVGRLYPVAAESVLPPHERSDASGVVGNG